MHEIAIDMQKVGKRFGRQWVVAGASLTIRRGEAVALFGGNGSGKSTLLRMIATLLPPSTGTLTVLGQDVAQEKVAIRRQLRFLAHEKQLYSALTVAENLRLAAHLRGLTRRQGIQAIEQWCERLQIAPLRHRRIMQLSEGLKKRVVLARLLIGREEPELILLDEPHPTLDVAGRRVLDDLIRAWRAAGKTILLASHDHAQTLAHVDRVLHLQGGRIRYDGESAAWEGCA